MPRQKPKRFMRPSFYNRQLMNPLLCADLNRKGMISFLFRDGNALRPAMYATVHRALISSPAVMMARVYTIALLTFQFGVDDTKKTDIYNILWALVFGFATLNILGLLARRFEPNRTRLNFGELLAVLVVCVAVFLLGWEMLYVFHILPIKLTPHD